MEVIFRGKKYRFDERITVREVLKRLNLSPEAVLVIRDDSVITEDEILEPDDRIKIISAISGGGIQQG